MGIMVGAGGILVPANCVSNLEATVNELCERFDFPPDAVFKWSPGTVEGKLVPDGEYVQEDKDYLYFGSAHPGTLNVSLGDGSVHSLSMTTAASVHRQLIHRADGSVVDITEL